MSQPDQGQGQGPAEPTVAQLAERQERVEGKLDQVIGLLQGGEHKAHAAAAAHEQDKLNRPSDTADEVRRQLEERDRAAKAKADADQAAATADSWKQGIETSLAELKEKPPEAPARRVEKFLGWR